MRVWCDSVDAAAIGKTAGTFDAVGTVTLKIGAKHILGFIVSIASSQPTGGQSNNGILRINSKDLSITNEDILLSGATTDGIATNDKESPVQSEFIPFKQSDALQKDLDNAKIDISLTSNTTNTGGFDVAVGVVHSDSLPDARFEMELLSGSAGRMVGGAVAEFDAGIKAATATSFTTGLSITSQGKMLIALSGYGLPNAPTADEAAVGIVEFQASQIPDFSPQRWPMNFAWTSSLGTPVGTPVSVNSRSGVYYPTRFPLPEKNFMMSVSMLYATALTNEADGLAAAKWK